jgi:hypothetical protein
MQFPEIDKIIRITAIKRRSMSSYLVICPMSRLINTLKSDVIRVWQCGHVADLREK